MGNKRVIKEADRNKFLAGILNESLFAAAGDEKKPERIYINRQISDYFDIPYSKNDGVETFINANTLRSKANWDSEHLSIFNKYAGKDLTLKGDGLGWWIIVHGLREGVEVTEFKFKVKHDNGVKKLKTKASSLEAAKKIIMNAEGCPEGALELISEMKKTYGQDGKASKSKYNKHLRPFAKKLANGSTRKNGKEISKNAEKEIDESFVRKMIKKAINETMLKEGIGVGDTVTNGSNFYKVIGEPFTATDNGAAQYAADNDGASLPSHIDYRSFYTAIRVKNIDTGNESTGAISNFKKINPDELEGLKQAKAVRLAQDAAYKAERDAYWAKDKTDKEEAKKKAEEERLQNIANSNIDKNDIIKALNYIFVERAYDCEEKSFSINGNDAEGILGVESVDEDGNTINSYELTYICDVNVVQYPSYDPGDRWTPPDGDDGQIEIKLNEVYVSKLDEASKSWSKQINYGKDNSLFPEALKEEMEEELNDKYWEERASDGPDGDY